MVINGLKPLLPIKTAATPPTKQITDCLLYTSDNIEHELQDKLNCSATIHIDPIVTDNKEVNEMRSQIEEITRNLDRRLSIHDFRIVEGPTHTNLIFDVAVPFECKLTNVEITNLLKERIRNMDDGNYCAVIQIDRVYS